MHSRLQKQFKKCPAVGGRRANELEKNVEIEEKRSIRAVDIWIFGFGLLASARSLAFGTAKILQR